MKYNAPYGAPEGSSWVNGNPATGVRGSIPNAGSQEYPQREIVAVIAAAGLTPTNDDLTQLLKAIQLIAPNVYVGLTDTGTANAVVIDLDPVPTEFSNGDLALIRKKAATPNNAAVTIDFNGKGAVSLKDNAGVDFSSGAILGGGLYLCSYLGGGWRVLGGAASYTNVTDLTANSGKSIRVGITGQVDVDMTLNTTHNTSPAATDIIIRQTAAGDIYQMSWEEFLASLPVIPTLQANRDYYVNVLTGSDSNDGLSSGAAFATLQKAADTVAKFNVNGFTVTIHVANGTYAPIALKPVNGSGQINFVGNSVTPANVLISSSAGSAIKANGVSSGYVLDGFKVQVSAPDLATGDQGAGVTASGSTDLLIRNFDFGACCTAHISASGARITVGPGTIKTSGGITVVPEVGYASHIVVDSGGKVATQGYEVAPDLDPDYVIPSAVSVGSFIRAMSSGSTNYIYKSLTGSGNVTGSRYSAFTNGIIWTNGAGENYYPGTTAGSKSLGGQYA